jgi:hypothetical protein
MTNNKIKTGGILAGAGCLFGIAPVALALAAAAIGSDAANVLPWLTYFTAPVGAVVVIVGLIIAIVGATKSTPEDLAKSVSTSADKSDSKTAAGPGTPSAPVALPPLSDSLARSVKIAYAIGFGIVLVSCVMRVTLFQPMSGILTFFDLVPVFFAGWFVFLARNAQNGLQFLRLVQAQMIVSIAGCVAGLWPLITSVTELSLLAYEDIDPFGVVGTLITGFIPALASLASLIFAGVARSRYRRDIEKS